MSSPRSRISPLRWLFWAWAWWTLRLTLMMVLRVKVRGQDQIPKRGGAMMLANHTTLFDVLVCFWAVNRPTHGIGSEQVFRLPVVGTLLEALGGIPYAKGAKDGGAVRKLVAAYENGGIIGMFPEGLRSWTGAPLPIRKGTGRLVKSLGCPVLYCRVHTGFLQHPRWAKWPRFIPWHLEYERVDFPEEATADEINAAIARGLAIDPESVELPKGSWGYRLAEGLPEFLWACPSCFAVESLQVQPDGDHVTCSCCEATWRVDLRCHLIGESSMSIAAARQRLSDHFDLDTPVECASMEVTRVRRGQLKREHLAQGEARLGPTSLELRRDGELVWELPYEDMSAVLLQFRNALQIRAHDANYQLDPGDHSRLRWHHFLAMRSKGLVG